MVVLMKMPHHLHLLQLPLQSPLLLNLLVLDFLVLPLDHLILNILQIMIGMEVIKEVI
jgi:hypothetical protein